jgi:hypothetical protein
MRFPPYHTLIVNYHPTDTDTDSKYNSNKYSSTSRLYNKFQVPKSTNNSNCMSYSNVHQSSIKWSGCLAVVAVDTPLAWNLNRFDSNPIYKGVIYLSIYKCVIYLSIMVLSIYLSIYKGVIYLSILSIKVLSTFYLSIKVLSIYLSIYLYRCYLSINVSIYLSIYHIYLTYLSI